jgi:dihydroneopterin aldolase
MTLFLASVRSAAEAETALAAGADIIDLKDPAKGALGAVDAMTARACLRRIGGRARVSATVGDLPMESGTVCQAVRATASLGMDFVKLGLFAEGDPLQCLEALSAETARTRLVLVLFADALPAFDAIAEAARIGAHGVMLDTARKDGRALIDHLDLAALGGFIAEARASGLLVGLAGSLQGRHVPDLLALEPDLLGFRSALCAGRAREEALDGAACEAIRALIPADERPSRPPPAPYVSSPALC